MGQISSKEDQLPKGTEVWVYGENDEQGTKPPHMHIKVDNKHEFEIQFDFLHNLDIWRSKTSKKDWHNYKNVKKAVLNWLDQNNYEQDKYTNVEMIFAEWNRQNPNHKIDTEKYLDQYKKFRKNK